jgi:hypothetical protein
VTLDIHPGRKGLEDILTREYPLGEPSSDALYDTSPEVFRRLYVETNHIRRSTRTDSPPYIVGRKGSGKTAFLIGEALTGDADLVLIQSEDLYAEVNKLNSRYRELNGPLVADSLAHVWELLLLHAGMWRIATSDRLPKGEPQRRVWTYMSSFGDLCSMKSDELLARVASQLREAVLSAPDHLSFREACWSMEPEFGSLSDAVEQSRAILAEAGHDSLYVVVDNLEDLHRHLDDFADIIPGLFRVVSRDLLRRKTEQLPFATRFAFPAELLPRLRTLTANAEKDFLDYRIVRWNAAELILLAGNRLRTFLDLHFEGAAEKLGLPTPVNSRDRAAADKTLRALLPEKKVLNGFGQAEDPVAYVMRHTQLLPRHLIEILNHIIAPAVARAANGDVPRATAEDVTGGVRRAEDVIVQGILTTYSADYPLISDALDAIKNHVEVSQPMSELHRAFNHAGVKRTIPTFEDFIDACLNIGALGIVTSDDSDGRYVQGHFSYTIAGSVRPVESKDDVCVHPLFMYRWFDESAIRQMRGRGVRAVYPYGSDPSDDASF